MRAVVAPAVAVLVLALPASAAPIDPETIVLRPAEAPPGFRLDRGESGESPNSRYARPASLQKVVAKSGRITGYGRVFRHRGSRVKVIGAGVDVYRRPDGAELMLSYHDAEQRRRNARRGIIDAYGRAMVQIGSKGWVYWSGYPGYYVLVVWRQGRLLGAVHSWMIGRESTLALAWKQQRRMASASP